MIKATRVNTRTGELLTIKVELHIIRKVRKIRKFINFPVMCIFLLMLIRSRNMHRWLCKHSGWVILKGCIFKNFASLWGQQIFCNHSWLIAFSFSNQEWCREVFHEGSSMKSLWPIRSRFQNWKVNFDIYGNYKGQSFTY